MAEYTKSIENFLSLYLSRPGSTLPKNALWVVNFEDLAGIKQSLLETAKSEPTSWTIDNGLSFYLDNPDYSKNCFFVQAVSVPGEQAIVNPEGFQYNSFIRTPVGGGRSDFPALQMTFLDSNISFVDVVLRTWVITTARLGMIARDPNVVKHRYRRTINIVKLGTFSRTRSGPEILQRYSFYNACPVSISSEEYNYTGATSPTNREVTFTFLDYKFESKGDSFINNNNTSEAPPKASSKLPKL